MRSIIYAGQDFCELCTAEVVGRSENPLIAETLEVPGRAGAMLVSSFLPPADVGLQPVDYASVSALAADMAALQSDVTGIDGNLTTAASVTVVENTVTTAIDDLDDLAEVEF